MAILNFKQTQHSKFSAKLTCSWHLFELKIVVLSIGALQTESVPKSPSCGAVRISRKRALMYTNAKSDVIHACCRKLQQEDQCHASLPNQMFKKCKNANFRCVKCRNSNPSSKPNLFSTRTAQTKTDVKPKVSYDANSKNRAHNTNSKTLQHRSIISIPPPYLLHLCVV